MKEFVYQIAPVWAQDLLVSVAGWRFMRQRYGSVYWKELARAASVSVMDRSELQDLQAREFAALVKHALSNSPFYAAYYRSHGIRSFKNLEQIAALPMVDKEMIRANSDQIYTVDSASAIVVSTGGTTGKSLQVRFTRDDFQRRMAILDEFKNSLGVETFSTRKATFSGRSVVRGVFADRSRKFWRTNAAYNQRLYSTFHLSAENITSYLNDLDLYKPEVINGFVSAIYTVALAYVAQSRRPQFSPQAIFTTSETLLDYHREVIESVFGCRLYNQYASAEGAPFVVECRKGKLHFRMDTGVIERVSVDGAMEAVVTSFTSYGTPLIRYRIGDVIEFSEESRCECGSAHPIVSKIDGRRVDFLEFGGQRVSLSHLADVIKGLPSSVIQMQFHQISATKLRVLVVPDPALYNDASEVSIYSELRYRFGPSVEIEVVRVDEIRPEISGKVPLIKKV